MIVTCSAPTDDLESSRAFYKAVLNLYLDSGEDNSLFAKIANPEVIFRIGPRHEPHEKLHCHFEVTDLDASVDAVTKHGGRILQPPSDIKTDAGKRIGRRAIVGDPHSNIFGLIELTP
jgi:predicted enzyme related to lactoylglutathione lyase